MTEQKDTKILEQVTTGVLETGDLTKSKWEKFKEMAIQLAGGLLMEKNKDNMWTISLGRVSFWLAFVAALVIWVKGNGSIKDGIPLKDISPNHLTVLLTLAAYNFSKKAMDTVKGILGKNNELQ